MAKIDDLIARIEDPNLRDALAEQAAKLTSRKEFGLVFQDHLPESIEVPGLRARTGDLAHLKIDDTRARYRVLSARAGKARVVPVSPANERLGQELSVPRADLIVIKDFGEPIYAGLKPLASIERGGDKPKHIVIQGENYYALEALLYTHERKVDVIYIDPPYNTGSSSWIYNDKFVDSGDDYRHSKWLAFMKRRLEHAKRLLKDTGVIIMAIDDTEQARLKLLADDVFGEQNFIANVVWQGGRKNDSRFVSVGHDYMLIYAKSADALREADIKWREEKLGLDEALAEAERIWIEVDGDAVQATKRYKAWLKAEKAAGRIGDGVFRYDTLEPPTGSPVTVDGNLTWPGGGGPRYDVLHPVTGKPVTAPSGGWRYTPERMQEEISAGRVYFGPDEKKIPRGKTMLVDLTHEVPTSVFSQERTPANKHLQDVLGSKEFPFPKDVDVIARWLNIVSANNPDAVVLDFFAGTGTTAEAVMRLNAQDGGRRQSIVVTNNELSAKTAKALRKAGHLPGDPEWEAEGVFHKVTWPRIETVVAGQRCDGSTYSEGLDENVEFFELTYEDPNLIALGRKFRAIAPLLWLKAGAKGTMATEIDTENGWSFPAGSTYGVLFDLAASSAFVHAVADSDPVPTHIFVVTDSEAQYQAVVAQLPPQIDTARLYSTYLASFELNGKD